MTDDADKPDAGEGDRIGSLPPPRFLPPPDFEMPSIPEFPFLQNENVGTGLVPQIGWTLPANSQPVSASDPSKWSCKSYLDICDGFSGSERSVCVAQMGDLVEKCENKPTKEEQIAYQKGDINEGFGWKPGMGCPSAGAYCRVDIESSLVLFDLIQSARLASTKPDKAEISKKLARLEEEAGRLTSEAKDIKGQRIYYYLNTNSGEIMEHAGPYFEPKPPLQYTGDAPMRLSQKDLARLDEIDASLQSIQKKSEKLVQADPQIMRQLANSESLLRILMPGAPGKENCTTEMIPNVSAVCELTCSSVSACMGNWNLPLVQRLVP